jgi:hypothetical protein
VGDEATKLRIWFGGFYGDMESFYERAERLWIDGLFVGISGLDGRDT